MKGESREDRGEWLICHVVGLFGFHYRGLKAL